MWRRGWWEKDSLRVAPRPELKWCINMVFVFYMLSFVDDKSLSNKTFTPLAGPEYCLTWKTSALTVDVRGGRPQTFPMSRWVDWSIGNSRRDHGVWESRQDQRRMPVRRPAVDGAWWQASSASELWCLGNCQRRFCIVCFQPVIQFSKLVISYIICFEHSDLWLRWVVSSSWQLCFRGFLNALRYRSATEEHIVSPKTVLCTSLTILRSRAAISLELHLTLCCHDNYIVVLLLSLLFLLLMVAVLWLWW